MEYKRQLTPPLTDICSAAQAESVMRQIMTGGASEAQIGAYLMALSMKGETTDEISGQRARHA